MWDGLFVDKHIFDMGGSTTEQIVMVDGLSDIWRRLSMVRNLI